MVPAQGQANYVDVVLLDRAFHRRTPAAADVKQRHAGLQTQLAEREIDLCHLRFFKRHVGTFEEPQLYVRDGS